MLVHLDTNRCVRGGRGIVASRVRCGKRLRRRRRAGWPAHGTVGVVVAEAGVGRADGAARGEPGDLVDLAGGGVRGRQEVERRRVAHRGGSGGRRRPGGERRGVVPGDGRVPGGVVAEDDGVPRDQRIGRGRGIQLGPLREVEVDARLGEETGDEAVIALLVLRRELPHRVLADELPARRDAGLSQHGVHDLGHAQVLEDPRPPAPLEEPETRDHLDVVLHRVAGLVDLLQLHRGHQTVERARRLADVPGEHRAPAEGEALDVLVGLGLGGHDDVEHVVLRHRLAAGEGVDAEVVGIEAVDGEAVGRGAGAARAQAARIEGRSHGGATVSPRSRRVASEQDPDVSDPRGGASGGAARPTERRRERRLTDPAPLPLSAWISSRRSTPARSRRSVGRRARSGISPSTPAR